MEQELIACDLIGDLPGIAARRWGEKLALVFDERSWTYADFDREVSRVANALIACGVVKGDRIAIWLNNCPEFEFLFFAIVRIGAIAVPLNTRYRAEDIAYALQASGVSMIFAADRSGPVDYDALLQRALGAIESTADGRIASANAPQLARVVMLGQSALPGAVPWTAFLEKGAGAAADIGSAKSQIAAEDAALIIYTSGTTGAPKGVMLNHTGLKLCRDRARIVGLRFDDIQLTYLPLFHIYALSYSVIMSFQTGAHQLLMETFDPEKALDLIEQTNATIAHGFDVHFGDMAAAQRRRPRDISSFRLGTMAVGAESSVEIARDVQERLCPTLSGYGMTELWGGVTITPPGSSISQRCEASGLPLPEVEIRVVDPETGAPLPAEALGELQVRSFASMVGYFGQPDATAESVTPDGWVRTGDAGIIRADGHIRFLGRYKDMLKVGGENVSPAEVELRILTLPGVSAVAVVGEPHSRLQEVVVAFVVLTPGSAVDEQAIIAHCRESIASFKVPRRVVFVDELPLSATGKVQKAVLRQRLAEAARSPLTRTG